MDRRDYLRACGIAVTGTLGATAGCLGFGSSGSSDAPPRKSKVIEEVTVEEGALVVDPYADAKQWVMSRRNIDLQDDSISQDIGATLGSLSPVGTAQAQKGGATGRGTRSGFRSAPKTGRGRHRRAWYGARDDDDEWYDEHEGEIQRLPVALGAVGVAYLGTDEWMRENTPGPGEPGGGWDETFDSPDASGTLSTGMVSSDGSGWYRVGANVAVDDSALESGENGNLGWECLDARVIGSPGSYSVGELWKVSPEI
jgi:hypothetical protein